ncbi:hypothetical protein [Rathayibacter soli]|uniref:hypothetical protein n=1 Tax=Rathayibacter soli TaxID=3144168 RepID=UPI0027E474D5|nr:hypothetical protein [Glaciibacter superstes]
MTASSLHVDLLVIGWGKAGKTLAKRYAATGKTVARVERCRYFRFLDRLVPEADVTEELTSGASHERFQHKWLCPQQVPATGSLLGRKVVSITPA